MNWFSVESNSNQGGSLPGKRLASPSASDVSDVIEVLGADAHKRIAHVRDGLRSLLHLLAVVVRVRDFAAQMPPPNPRFDLFVALLAIAGICTLALSQQLGLDGWRGPAAAALLAAYAILGARVAALAARVVIRARPSI